MELQYHARNKIYAIRKTETWKFSWTEDSHPTLNLDGSGYDLIDEEATVSIQSQSQKRLKFLRLIDLKKSARMLNVIRTVSVPEKSGTLLAATAFTE